MPATDGFVVRLLLSQVSPAPGPTLTHRLRWHSWGLGVARRRSDRRGGREQFRTQRGPLFGVNRGPAMTILRCFVFASSASSLRLHGRTPRTWARPCRPISGAVGGPHGDAARKTQKTQRRRPFQEGSKVSVFAARRFRALLLVRGGHGVPPRCVFCVFSAFSSRDPCPACRAVARCLGSAPGRTPDPLGLRLPRS